MPYLLTLIIFIRLLDHPGKRVIFWVQEMFYNDNSGSDNRAWDYVIYRMGWLYEVSIIYHQQVT